MINMRFWILLCALFAALGPLVCHAESNVELIEHLLPGRINWTRGVVVAHGKCQSAAGKETPQSYAAGQALRRARVNVHETINQLRVSSCSSVAELTESKKEEYRQIKDMAMAAEVIETKTLPDGSIEVAVQMDLFGGFAQLILPGTIRQVEPIKPLTPSGDNLASSQLEPADSNAAFAESDIYTGLIVDARGIGVKPTMVPVIVDESGQEVYGPAYVSREYAVQRGVCQYVRWVEAFSDTPRVAPNPLIVKGLRMTTGPCRQIVVSNADASKLRGSSLHLGFLKQCRVIIALDDKVR